MNINRTFIGLLIITVSMQVACLDESQEQAVGHSSCGARALQGGDRLSDLPTCNKRCLLDRNSGLNHSNLQQPGAIVCPAWQRTNYSYVLAKYIVGGMLVGSVVAAIALRYFLFPELSYVNKGLCGLLITAIGGLAGHQFAPQRSLHAEQQLVPATNFEARATVNDSCASREITELTRDQLLQEIQNSKNVLSEGMFKALTISANQKCLVVGDIHGGCEQLMECINLMRAGGCFNSENSWVLQDDYLLIFTGDIADRGRNGLGAWQIIMKLIQHNPGRCILIRGNHETRLIAERYGFFDELRAKYQQTYGAIRDSFLDLFNKLPNVLFLGIRQPNNTVLFGIYCHGGPDPRVMPASVQNLIAESMSNKDRLISKTMNEMVIQEARVAGLGCSLFSAEENGYNWSDFELLRLGQRFAPSQRGAGFVISYEGVREILESYSTARANVCYVVRGHQHLSGSVNKFDGTTGNWDCLTAPQIIEPNSIFTCMCLSPAVPTNDQAGDHQVGYGLIESTQNNQLMITPHILQLHQREE